MARYERQVAVTVCDNKAVTVDVGVLDLEAEVMDGHLDLTARRFRQERHHLDRLGAMALEVIEQVAHGQAGVHDVIYQQHVASVAAVGKALHETNFTAA